jgi:tryprostatin B 6-hydroxylase
MSYSEPVAGVLLSAFYFLTRFPEHADKIYEEVRDVDTTNMPALAQLPHLNAVINESARHFPTVLTGTSRMAGKDGVTIGGVYIPPYTKLITPRYSIYRSEY